MSLFIEFVPAGIQEALSMSPAAIFFSRWCRSCSSDPRFVNCINIVLIDLRIARKLENDFTLNRTVGMY
jgi:hypothetical protein